MPALTSRVPAPALVTALKFSQEYYIRGNFPSSFRAGLTIHASCESVELIGKGGHQRFMRTAPVISHVCTDVRAWICRCQSVDHFWVCESEIGRASCRERV